MSNPTIGRFMTTGVHTIGREQSLAHAHRLMNESSVRHLPVLDRGRLVGMVSLRDLHFLETLEDVDPDTVTVAEAMSAEVYTVSRRTPLRRVAARMAAEKLGSAVVVDDRRRVVGIFTTVDALRALAEGPPARRRVTRS